MANRITQRDLESLARQINRATGNPESPYADNPETGRHEPQAGCYHISYAYGGAALHQMSTRGGSGVSDVFGGHMPKRQLWEKMCAFLSGIDHGARATA